MWCIKVTLAAVSSGIERRDSVQPYALDSVAVLDVCLIFALSGWPLKSGDRRKDLQDRFTPSAKELRIFEVEADRSLRERERKSRDLPWEFSLSVTRPLRQAQWNQESVLLNRKCNSWEADDSSRWFDLPVLVNQPLFEAFNWRELVGRTSVSKECRTYTQLACSGT